ncbi:hypothetical protein GCK32_021395 [Trichostrongylus colubriformis]|uniref:G protein-coupled receptor n=1 Tax=Trichostrongylus colubriformis TaxID=6319 RepID=A0AAN8J2S4_TRICO
MSHLIIIIDSMLTLPLIATLGIYWAVQINKFLKESSFSSHTKAMQRRMNNLMIIQTACPVLLLHAPAFGQYILVLLGSTSNTAVTYFSQTLWTVFPVFSALVIMAFFREYRDLFLRKVCKKKKSPRVLVMSLVTRSNI